MSLKSHKVLESTFRELYSGSQDVVSGTVPSVREVVAKMQNYPIFMKLHWAMVEGQRVTVLALYFNYDTAIKEVGYARGFAVFACRPDEQTRTEKDEIVTEHQNDGQALNGGSLAIIQEIEIMIRKLGGLVVEAPQ